MAEYNEDEFIQELLNEENVDKSEENEEKVEKNVKLPLARIKSLMKMDPDINIVSQESIFLVARATELFLKNLAQVTYNYTAKSKRKTVQRKDVDAAIENIDAMCFLEGALD